MFESIKHWLDSLEKESRLFDHADNEALHSALASVLYHLINADHRIAEREKHMFERILRQEFDLNDAQISHLYQAASSAASDPHDDLKTIAHYLKQNPAIRKNFMEKLMQLIDIDGTQDEEMEFFYEALHEVFPEIRQ